MAGWDDDDEDDDDAQDDDGFSLDGEAGWPEPFTLPDSWDAWWDFDWDSYDGDYEEFAVSADYAMGEQ